MDSQKATTHNSPPPTGPISASPHTQGTKAVIGAVPTPFTGCNTLGMTFAFPDFYSLTCKIETETVLTSGSWEN